MSASSPSSGSVTNSVFMRRLVPSSSEVAVGRRAPQLGRAAVPRARARRAPGARTASSYISVAKVPTTSPIRSSGWTSRKRTSRYRPRGRTGGNSVDRCWSGPVNGVAPRANAAYAATGSLPRSSRSSNAVRPGSTASHVESREPGPTDRAYAAARCGPARLSTRHCSRPARPGPPVEADLGRSRAPHHPAAGRTDGVEVRLHGGVSRRGQLERHLVRRAAGRRGRDRARSRPARGRCAARTGCAAAAGRRAARGRTAGSAPPARPARRRGPTVVAARTRSIADRSPGRGVTGEQLVLDAHPGRAPVGGAGEEP